MNDKAVFILINKSDYNLIDKALSLIENQDKKVLNTRIREREISDIRKCIIKKSIDHSPNARIKHLAKVFDCSIPAIKESYKQANILFANNDEEFINLFNSIK